MQGVDMSVTCMKPANSVLKMISEHNLEHFICWPNCRYVFETSIHYRIAAYKKANIAQIRWDLKWCHHHLNCTATQTLYKWRMNKCNRLALDFRFSDSSDPNVQSERHVPTDTSIHSALNVFKCLNSNDDKNSIHNGSGWIPPKWRKKKNKKIDFCSYKRKCSSRMDWTIVYFMRQKSQQKCIVLNAPKCDRSMAAEHSENTSRDKLHRKHTERFLRSDGKERNDKHMLSTHTRWNCVFGARSLVAWPNGIPRETMRWQSRHTQSTKRESRWRRRWQENKYPPQTSCTPQTHTQTQ